MADPIGYVILEWTDGVPSPMVYQTSMCSGPAYARAVAQDLQEATDVFKGTNRYTAAAVVPIETWERLNRRLDDLVENPLGELM